MAMNENSSSDDDGWSDCEVPEDVIVGCLFCDLTFKSCEDLFAHCATSHHFDITKLKSEMALDCFSYIRLINYIRKARPSAANVQVSQLLHFIVDDAYLMPVIEDDPLLMFDIEDLLVCCENAEAQLPADKKQCEHNRLEDRLKETENRLQETQRELAFAMEQIALMKRVAFEGLGSDGENAFVTSDAKHAENMQSEGDGYFSSYAHYGIHHEMLQDEVRTLAYRDAILKNQNIFEGKTVLDVGCGTAILSMFAAQSGARHVFGVDQSEIIYRAMDIVRENHLEDRVTLLKGRMEDVHLKDKVDILVSEWMGYFLLFESMLDTVIYARENHLNKYGGLMLPNRSTINIAGICDMHAHLKLVSFWDDVYGFKMTCLKREVVQEATVELVGSDKLITESCLVQDLNLMVCTTKDVEFSAAFQLNVLRQGLLTGFVGWFDTYFDLPNRVTLFTSPFSPSTHWKQTVFYLLTPLPVNEGDIIEGKISCKRLAKNQRCLKVQLDFNNAHHTYLLQ